MPSLPPSMPPLPPQTNEAGSTAASSPPAKKSFAEIKAERAAAAAAAASSSSGQESSVSSSSPSSTAADEDPPRPARAAPTRSTGVSQTFRPTSTSGAPSTDATPPRSVSQWSGGGGATPVSAGRSTSGWGARGALGSAGTVRPNSGAGLTPKQEKEFEEMLVAMNLPPAGRAQMGMLPPSQKLDLLESHKLKLKNMRVQDKGGKVKNSPQFFINQLATPTGHELQTLRICAVSEPIIWLETFHSLGGITLVVKIINDLQKAKEPTPADEETLLEAVRCIVSMCKADGLKMVTSIGNVVPILALCIDTRDPLLKMEVYDFLSLLCNLLGDYYQMVVDAMDTYKYQKRETIKYQALVQSLQHEENPTVQARALQLINSLISAPSELEQRVNIRNGFLRLGLRDVLNRVKKSIPHNVDFGAQFDSFVLDEKDDQEALQSVIPGYDPALADASDDRGMFEAIKRKVAPSTVLASQFQSVLGALLRLPTDEKEGPKIWNLVSTLLQQISLGKGYLAVDGEYVLDVQELLNSNALRAELEIACEDHKNLEQSLQEQVKQTREQNRNLKDKLAAAEAAPKQEEGVSPEAIKKLEGENSDLKEELEEAQYNAEKAGSRVADLAAVIERLEASKELERLTKVKELETIKDAHESEIASAWNDRMVELARKEEEIAGLKRAQLDDESKIAHMERSVKDLESKLEAAEAAGGGDGSDASAAAMESDALLKWAMSQEELSKVERELTELKKDFLEVNSDRARMVTKAAEAKQKVEEQLLDAKQSLEIAKRSREAAEMNLKEMQTTVEGLKKELEELKANGVVAGAGAGGEGGVPAPPAAPGAEGEAVAAGGDAPAPPPPPPPPPGSDMGGGGPPPPPPPPGGGPPPPPPPPGGGPPGPPPPPGAPGAPGFAVVKKWRPNLPKPAVKTKQLNWQKLPNMAAEGSCFGELREGLDELPIDWSNVEAMFAAPVARPKNTMRGTEKKESTEVLLLDPKRAHSIGIYLRRLNFNVSVENIVEAIGTFDRSTIDLEFIERLIFNAPTPDEAALIKAYEGDGGDPTLMGKPEQFFFELTKIPMLVARLTSYKTVLTFKKRSEATKGQLNGLRDAFDQLQNSTRLKDLLKVVLALGNFLNGRSARGEASGFKLESLTHLVDTKTSDNKSTLLHWLVGYLNSNNPSILAIASELGGVAAASGTRWDELKMDIAALAKDQKALSVAAVQVQIMEGEEFRDAWPKIVTDELVSEYKDDIETLERGIASAETEWNTLATMYGENTANTRPEQLLGEIGQFITAFASVRKELTMAAAVDSSSKNTKGPVKRAEETTKVVDAVAGGGTVEDVDDLKAAIQSGSAFEARREQRRNARGQTLRGHRAGQASVDIK